LGEVEIDEKWQNFMDEAWLKALEKLKQICEENKN